MTKKSMLAVAVLCAVFQLAPNRARAQLTQPSTTVGVVSHINLVSDKSPDVSTLEAWKKSYIKDGMTDQEKAIAIFNTIVRYRHQANPPREYLSSEMAGGHVHDPLKSFHVYGYGQCCCASAEVQGLARYLGMKTRGRPVTVHSVAEVYCDNGWRLIDPSVMNYHVKEDGKLASVDEIHAAVDEWLKKNPDFAQGEIKDRDTKLRKFAKNEGWKQGPPLLAKADEFYGKNGVNSAGWHGWPSTMIEYSKVEPPDEFYATMGYQLNVQLRPGERITRNFSSRGIEYTNKASKKYYDELLDRKVLGIQTKLGDIAPGRIGDGTIEWTVPMTQLNTVALSSDANSFVLRFPSSYVYVTGQAKVKANVASGGNVAVSFSDNNGLDWKPLKKIDKSGEETIDLTALVQRRYDYRLKFDLSGQGTKVEGIHAIHDFQCSQAALPTIAAGENKMTFSAGPQEGTVTIEGSTNVDDAKKNQQLTIADFKPVLNGVDERLRMTSGTGDATFNLTTPGEMKRLRISAGWRARDAAKDGWEVQVSYDGGKTFSAIENGKLQGGTKGESRYVIASDVPAGTRAAQVRLAGKQSNTTLLFDLRIDADYTEPAGGFKPVKITYNWDESGQSKTHTHVANSANENYAITCGSGAVVKSYTMELAD
ncbi:MAG: hypothetical protein QOF78_172 [Phycisphaerales bacterium]|jgi:hypothetical protein|nr:hypothetical protein [Phycisphaerales bacterium]